MGRVLRRVEAAMAGQYGLVSRAQATDLGVSIGQIERRLASGHWVRVERGVYRAAAAPPHALAPVIAATLSSCGLASHRSALHVHGLYPLPTQVEIVGPRHSKYNGPAKLYRKDLSRFRATKRLGIPTLDVAGALLTSAEVLHQTELADVVALAVSKRLVVPSRLLDALGDTRGRHGSGLLRRALRAYVNAAAEESVLERRIVKVLRDAGLPRPVAQHRVRIGGTTYRLDHAWPGHKVALESDGFEYHSSRRSFEADRRRRNRLEAAGWLVLNATQHDVDAAPHELVATVAAALAMRATG